MVSILWFLTWDGLKQSEQDFGRKLGYWDGAFDVVASIGLGGYREGEGKNPRCVFTVKDLSLMKVTINGVDTLRVW